MCPLLRMRAASLGMLSKTAAMIGQRFGRLVVKSDAGTDKWRTRLFHCVCDCGNERIVTAYALRVGSTQSCGCLRIERVSQKLRVPLVQRFWAKVKRAGEDECWEWRGAVDRQTGYGKITLGAPISRIVGAHRISFEMHHGPVPAGLDVCHACNNRVCVNPRHLYAGTRKQNVDQAIREGRMHWQQSKADIATKPPVLEHGD